MGHDDRVRGAAARRGIPQALSIAAPFLDGASLALILGDNLFFGTDLPEVLRVRDDDRDVFAYQVEENGFGR